MIIKDKWKWKKILHRDYYGEQNLLDWSCCSCLCLWWRWMCMMEWLICSIDDRARCAEWCDKPLLMLLQISCTTPGSLRRIGRHLWKTCVHVDVYVGRRRRRDAVSTLRYSTLWIVLYTPNTFYSVWRIQLVGIFAALQTLTNLYTVYRYIHTVHRY